MANLYRLCLKRTNKCDGFPVHCPTLTFQRDGRLDCASAWPLHIAINAKVRLDEWTRPIHVPAAVWAAFQQIIHTLAFFASFFRATRCASRASIERSIEKRLGECPNEPNQCL